MRQTIDGAAFQKMILSAAASIEIHKQQINELNVFPVPDGRHRHEHEHDAERSGSRSAQGGQRHADEGRRYHGFGHAARRARQLRRHPLALFRGFSKALKGVEACTGEQLAQALRRRRRSGLQGRDEAHGGHDPDRGPASPPTRPWKRPTAGADCEAVLKATVRSAAEALAQTVNQNPVLQKAGVVDARRQGLAVCARGHAFRPPRRGN